MYRTNLLYVLPRLPAHQLPSLSVSRTSHFFYEGEVLDNVDQSTRPWFFSWTFAIAACTIISGCLAERTALSAYPVATLAIAGLVHPLLVHWMWSPHGWMRTLGQCQVLDFAGGMAVHMLGGVFGLVGAWRCGPRLGRFELTGADDAAYAEGAADDEGAATEDSASDPAFSQQAGDILALQLQQLQVQQRQQRQAIVGNNWPTSWGPDTHQSSLPPPPPAAAAALPSPLSEASSPSGAHVGHIQLHRLTSGPYSRPLSEEGPSVTLSGPGAAVATAVATAAPCVVSCDDQQTAPAGGGSVTICAATSAAAAAVAAHPRHPGPEASLAEELQQLPQIQTRPLQRVSPGPSRSLSATSFRHPSTSTCATAAADTPGLLSDATHIGHMVLQPSQQQQQSLHPAHTHTFFTAVKRHDPAGGDPCGEATSCSPAEGAGGGAAEITSGHAGSSRRAAATAHRPSGVCRAHGCCRGKRKFVAKPMLGHDMALVTLGTFMLWFGWFGEFAQQCCSH
jgi:hypothetical protein